MSRSDQIVTWNLLRDRHGDVIDSDPEIARHVATSEGAYFAWLDLESRAALRRHLDDRHVEDALVEMKGAVLAADDSELTDMLLFFESWAMAFVQVHPHLARGRARQS